MDILEALKQQVVKSESERKFLPDGSLSIHNAVFETALFRLGVDADTIADCLMEPVELRDGLLNYFEGRA